MLGQGRAINPKPLVTHTVSEPKTKIFENRFADTAAPRVVELNSGLEPTAMIMNNEGLNP